LETSGTEAEGKEKRNANAVIMRIDTLTVILRLDILWRCLRWGGSARLACVSSAQDSMRRSTLVRS